MKRILAALLLLISFYSPAQFKLSDQAKFSLVTLGPDQDEFYEAFGHSAIRLVDPVNGIDYAYNYGEFSFHQPNFYLNFAKGHLNYSLGVVSYPDFKEAYIYYNRFIHEQTLNLSQAQTQKIFDYLQQNARPENKYYRYDYFFNNCSTKIRDLFADLLKEDLQFDQSFLKTGPTIRQLTDIYLDKQPWGDLGIDIGLGSRIDQEAAPYEYMFLPDYLEYSFDHATVNVNGNRLPLVQKKTTVYEAHAEDDSPGWLNPWIVLGALLLLTLVITVLDLRKKKLSGWLDVVLLCVTGFLGVVLMLLWFATDHHACAKNLNLAWAWPTHLVIGLMLISRSRPAWLRWYFTIAGIVTGLLLMLWFVLPQQLNGFLFPFLLTLAIRLEVNAWFLRKQPSPQK